MAALGKPSFTRCEYQCDAGCAIFDSPERPEICHRFQCMWLRGFGPDDARPDRSGLMVSINESSPGKAVGFAVEVKPNAVQGGGREIAVEFARTFDLPLIVGEYGKDTPGEWVILHDRIREPAARMTGRPLANLAPDVAVYELVI